MTVAEFKRTLRRAIRVVDMADDRPISEHDVNAARNPDSAWEPVTPGRGKCAAPDVSRLVSNILATIQKAQKSYSDGMLMSSDTFDASMGMAAAIIKDAARKQVRDSIG